MSTLHWLPPAPDDWRARLRALGADSVADPDQLWAAAVALAQNDLSFVLTNNLDQALRRALPGRPPGVGTRPYRRSGSAACGGDCGSTSMRMSSASTGRS